MRRLHQFILLVLLTLLSSGAIDAQAVAQVTPAMQLAHDGAQHAAAPMLNRAPARRHRIAMLSPAVSMTENWRAGLTIALDPFPETPLIGEMSHVQSHADGAAVCSGIIIGGSEGAFVLAVADNALVGAIWTANGAYEIRSHHDSADVTITQIDSDGFGDCECQAAHVITPAKLQGQLVAAKGNANTPHGHIDGFVPNICGSALDVMVVYTPATRTALGSDEAVRAFAHAAVASKNIANANSAVTARFRLVHVAPISYVESNSSLTTDLNRIQNTNDGFLDEVHALRTQYGADLVALLVDSFAPSCGVAFVMNDASPTFRPWAFSVTQQSCALANLSFAHELAHNLGCQHDWNDPSAGIFTYSHGYRFAGASGQLWRTVMAGSPGIRIPYFSNPNLVFDGVAMGIAEGNPQPADNARTINNTAPVAHQFVLANVIDCNMNGQDDACDVIAGLSSDVNSNGVPDECDSAPCVAAETQTLMAPGALSFEQAGRSVSMSNDWAVMGAALDDGAGIDAGAVHVFKRNGDQWQFETTLRPNDPANFQWFGYSVAISPGGTHILIGAPRDEDGLSDSGAAYIFTLVNDSWIQNAKLINPDQAQADWFGWSVAWAGSEINSLIAVIGAPFDDEAANDAGAVYFYESVGGQWPTAVKRTAQPAGAGDRFGLAVAGASSGDRVVVGAPLHDFGATNAGAMYVLQRVGGVWTQETRLTAAVAGNDARLGSAVSIDGDHAIAGAPRDDEFGVRAGAAHVFAHRSGQWFVQQKLTAAAPEPQAQFGAAVAIRGERALIGAILDSFANAASGAAYIYRRTASHWTQQARVAPSHSSNNDNFGAAVAIAPDGLRAVAGATLDDHSGVIDAGSATVFSLGFEAPDCNGNGQPDVCDISSGSSADVNRNGVPDECEPVCEADIAGDDNSVGVPDLLAVISHWGACPPPCTVGAAATCLGDITHDCQVGVPDLLAVIVNWGPCR